MNYFELQIGSIVKISNDALYKNYERYRTKEKDNLWVVRTIGYNVELERLYNPSHETTKTVENEHIAPIDIVPDWLLLLGYKLEGQEFVFSSNSEAVELEYQKDNSVIYTGGEGVKLSHNLKHVHQIQLLTIAITGNAINIPFDARYKKKYTLCLTSQ